MKQEDRFDVTAALFDQLYRPLVEDAHRALKVANENPTPYNMRVAFRVVFSAIEGLIWILKQNIIVGLHLEDGIYSLGEIAFLKEEAYQLKNRGEVEAKQRFIRVSENLLFAWKMYFRGVLPDFSPTLDGEGWKGLQHSLKARNRITHPRSPSDLDVNQDDLKALSDGFDWVVRTTFQNMARALLRMRACRFEYLKKCLSVPALTFLASIRSKEAMALGAMTQSVTALKLDNYTASEIVLTELHKHDLVRQEEGQLVLTSDGALFLKRNEPPLSG